jgi:hypothetical protein
MGLFYWLEVSTWQDMTLRQLTVSFSRPGSFPGYVHYRVYFVALHYSN